MSDVFYPDNPKRRARAEQLKTDIDIDVLSFKQYQKKMDSEADIKELGQKLNEFLKKLGYNSPEELDKKVQSVLKGNALSDSEYYRAHKKQYTNKFSETESSITSAISAISGVILGGLVVLGFMTGGVALGLLGFVGAVAAVLGLILVLFAVFEGAKERANMREAIHKLGTERVKVRKSLKELEAISSWLLKISKKWLTDPIYIQFPDLIKKELEGGFYGSMYRRSPLLDTLNGFVYK